MKKSQTNYKLVNAMEYKKIFLTGKIGKSVKFNESTWGAVGGDNEVPVLLRKMAELYPDYLFIIISKNDISRSREKALVPENIVDVYNGASKEDKLDKNYLVNKLSDNKIDGCFLFSGTVSPNTNIPDVNYKKTALKKGKKEIAKTLYCFANYVGPIYNYLNETQIPWILVSHDPRYNKQGQDLLNTPEKILSQFNCDHVQQHLNNFEEQEYVKETIPCEYAGMERTTSIGLDVKEIRNFILKKDILFSVVLNQGRLGHSRYPLLKEYVLDNLDLDEIKIAGKWDEEILENDERFIGPVKFAELREYISRIKYTFIIPIAPGWVTSKYIEMFSLGVIPFFHSTYDTQFNLDVPDYLRVNSAEELKERINELENNKEMYNEILEGCLKNITPEDISGERMSKTILENTPEINKPGKIPEHAKSVCNSGNSIDDW